MTSFDYYKKGAGIIPLIKAFKKFNDVYDDSRLVIIGGGKHFDEIRGKGSNKNINFLGKQPKSKVIEYMASCDCFVHITKLDNLPLTIIEATKFNKPIIASNKFGIPEISKDIYLTNNNEKNILKKMFEVYETQDKIKKYRFIGKFKGDRTAKEYVAMYSELLSKK